MPSRHIPTASLAALLLIACGGGSDPILERAEQMGGGASSGAAPAPATTGKAPAQPRPGVAATPEPGVAGAPQPGRAGSPQPVRVADPEPGTPDEPTPVQPDGSPGAGPSAAGGSGAQITVAGSVEVPAWKGGAIRIDIFDGDQRAAAGQDGQRPRVVAAHELSKPGPFSVSIPASVPQVWVGGFVDEDGDGRPSHTDPTGWFGGNPVTTAGGVDGLVLRLETAPPPPGAGG